MPSFLNPQTCPSLFYYLDHHTPTLTLACTFSLSSYLPLKTVLVLWPSLIHPDFNFCLHSQFRFPLAMPVSSCGLHLRFAFLSLSVLHPWLVPAGLVLALSICLSPGLHLSIDFSPNPRNNNIISHSTPTWLSLVFASLTFYRPISLDWYVCFFSHLYEIVEGLYFVFSFYLLYFGLGYTTWGPQPSMTTYSAWLKLDFVFNCFVSYLFYFYFFEN